MSRRILLKTMSKHRVENRLKKGFPIVIGNALYLLLRLSLHRLKH